MIDVNTINFEKGDGLVPGMIQDRESKTVLMLGYMNKAALEKTLSDELVTFWSRTKNRLWRKGESSGNTLKPVTIDLDCDQDTLLIQVDPKGPTCHTGSNTCWGEQNMSNTPFLDELQQTICDRKSEQSTNSYTSSLFKEGINKIAQKVGEEAVELIIESKDQNDILFLNEAADLMYHYIVLLVAKGYEIQDVVNVLKERAK